METKTKYLTNGEEVHLINKVKGGYLVRRIFIDNFEELSEEQEGDIEFVDRVWDNPPTEKLHTDVLELTKKIDSLQSELNQIRLLKTGEESVLNKISKIPNFQMVVDYFNGDYKFILDVSKLVIKDQYRTWKNPNIAITMVTGKGVVFYTLKSDYHHSDKEEVEIFKTLEDAQVSRKNHFLDRISNTTWIWGFDDLQKNSDYSDLFLQEDVVKLFNEKKAELQKKDLEKKIDGAKKAVQENMKILKENGIEI